MRAAFLLAILLTAPLTAQQRSPGVIALLRGDTPKKLELTEQQRTMIQALLDGVRTELRPMMQKMRSGDGDRQALRGEISKLRAAALANAVALLTEAQQKKWAALQASANRRGGTPTRFDRPPRDLGLDDIQRVRRPRGGGRGKLRVYKTEPHAVAEKGYVVLTDHVDDVARQALDKLAAHRQGRVVAVEDLTALSKDAKARTALRETLRKDLPRFVAIAPRPTSYREKTVLALWDVLATLDDDPELDVLPGFLVASTPKHLAALVDRTIAYRPVAKPDFHAFAIAEVPPDLLYKSYESSGLLKKLFAKHGVAMHDLTIPANAAIRACKDFPKITGTGRYEIRKTKSRDLLTTFPKDVRADIERSAFVWVLGHGRPGMACAAKVEAYTAMDLTNKIVFCGSCFATSAPQSDLVVPRSRGGSDPSKLPRFGLSAMDDGCVVVVGNMAFSRGVHFLLPIFEECLDGLTVGEAFQRLLNAQLRTTKLAAPYIKEPARRGPNNMTPEQRRANQLVNVLLGDPAIRPFAGLTK